MAPTLLLPNLDRDDDDGTVSRHELVRFLAGELSAERRAALAARIAAEPALSSRLDALAAEERAAEAAFRLEVPLPRFLLEQEGHEARERRGRPGGGPARAGRLVARLASLRFTLGTSALVATAAAVLFLVRAPERDGAESPATLPYDGLKGGARVGFFVKDEAGARFGKAGEELRAGDRIQFAVRDDELHPTMVLVGIDGRGDVTVVAAEDTAAARAKGDAAAPSHPTGPRLLPVSLVLDDATGAERFFVVYGDGSVDEVTRAVEAAARELAAGRPNLVESERLPLPSSWAQGSVHILKVKDAAGGGRSP